MGAVTEHSSSCCSSELAGAGATPHISSSGMDGRMPLPKDAADAAAAASAAAAAASALLAPGELLQREERAKQVKEESETYSLSDGAATYSCACSRWAAHRVLERDVLRPLVGVPQSAVPAANPVSVEDDCLGVAGVAISLPPRRSHCGVTSMRVAGARVSNISWLAVQANTIGKWGQWRVYFSSASTRLHVLLRRVVLHVVRHDRVVAVALRKKQPASVCEATLHAALPAWAFKQHMAHKTDEIRTSVELFVSASQPRNMMAAMSYALRGQ
jgi:hypothetical protein